MTKILLKLILILNIISLGCSTKPSTTKSLSMPKKDEIKLIRYVYFTSGFNDGYGATEGVYYDSKLPDFYEKLSEAKYIKKMKSNDIINSENAVITIEEKNGNKLVFTTYPKNNIYYLEDNNNLDLYSCDEYIFGYIKHHYEINKNILYTGKR